MKQVNLKMVTEVSFTTYTDDADIAQLEAIDAVRATFRGKGYTIETLSTVDVENGQPGLRVMTRVGTEL